jgi:Protein of unknown function (DUF2975)
MKTVKIIANILYYLTKIGSILYFLVAAYATIVILLNRSTTATWVPMIELKDGSFQIFLPFTRSPFLLGDNNTSYFITSLLAVTLYGIFLWLLSGVFNAFRQDRLFTSKSVSRLSRFYLANLTIPVFVVVLLVILGQDVQDTLMISFLHIILGVFAFFMAVIFKQGLILQEEQDLTL